MLRYLSLALALVVTSVAFATPAFAQQPTDVKVTLATDKATYAPGEPVNLTLSVTNNGSQPADLLFNNGQEIDYFAMQNGQEVWRWSIGKFFTQNVHTVTLAPGETKTYEDQWLQIANGGQAPDGQYEMSGVVTTGPGLPSNVVTITIGSAPAGQPSATPTATPGGPTLPQTGGPGAGFLLLIAGVLGILTLSIGIFVRRKA
jgi:LPXTG-motif cell wall-anchored protein